MLSFLNSLLVGWIAVFPWLLDGERVQTNAGLTVLTILLMVLGVIQAALSIALLALRQIVLRHVRRSGRDHSEYVQELEEVTEDTV